MPPFDGNGTFTRIYSWQVDAANGIDVRADRTDTDSDDIAAGLSNCVTRDGQSPPTANLPMGGFKWTGLGNGSAAADSVNFAQVFVSPTFTAPSATATPANGDNSTLLATTAFVNQVAFSAALPAQTGNTNKWLTTSGTNASWQPLPGNDLYAHTNLGGF